MHDAIGELARARALERFLDCVVEGAARRKLPGHALEHAVLCERTREFLRHRPSERPVEGASELGGELVGRCFELVAGSPGGRPRGKERNSAGCRRETRSLSVVSRSHELTLWLALGRCRRSRSRDQPLEQLIAGAVGGDWHDHTIPGVARLRIVPMG